MTTTFKEIYMDFKTIHTEAVLAGVTAEQAFIAQHGETPYCGFGWVEIPNGRSPFVKWCKQNSIGDKHWKKGWSIWRPTNSYTQSMDVQEVGATAFAKVLQANGIEAYMASRAD